MGKDFDHLCKALNKLDGLKIIDTSAEDNWVHFKLSNHSVLQALQSLAQEVAENYPCSLLVLSKEGKPKEFFYQLVFEEAQKSVAAQLLQKKLDNLIKSEGNLVKAKHPDSARGTIDEGFSHGDRVGRQEHQVLQAQGRRVSISSTNFWICGI